MNNGGPAFPVTGFCIDASGAFCDKTVESQGMSLRDWFAGNAMTALLVTRTRPLKNKSLPQQEIIAVAAYMIADAMLKERETDHEP